ncbi:E3 ubiquitin-protein ligase TRIM4 isoform 1-T1 [Glossophaga mutica]
MAAEDLQEELSCPICLEYFQDPVSLECGHNFCRRCLRYSLEQGGRSFPCPECRQLSSPTALRPNWALTRLVDRARRLHPHPTPDRLCNRHGEPLRLFCEDDQRPVCLVCRESQEHQDHSMAPVQEAFESYREKLLKTEHSLMAKIEEVTRLQDAEMKNAAEWKDKMNNQQLKVSAQFAKLHHFLDEEEHLFLQRLSEEEKETKKKQAENTLRLNRMITSLKKLKIEVEERSQSCTLKLLQNPKDLLTRSENQDVNYSVKVLQVKTECHVPMMKEMLKRFQVAISLAEDTAHPKLVFSQQGRCVQNGAPASSWPVVSSAWNYVAAWRKPQQTTYSVKRFQHLPSVLGKNIFTSGKHYWEVENQSSLVIAVGVSREDILGIVDNSEISPDVGIWAICWNSTCYWPLTGNPVISTSPEPALQRVGVFLDYEAGDISFYNAVDGMHIHTFSCSFVSHLRPFFWLSPLASLILPPVTGGK